MEINADWLSAPVPSPRTSELPADKATLAAIRISAGGRCLTRLRDETGEERDSVRVSGYWLALWVSRNWWRLGFEAERADYQSDLAWMDGHSLTSIGEGWLWPRVTIAADGESVVLRSTPAPASLVEPVTWLSSDEVRVPGTAFVECAQRFIGEVFNRLGEAGLKDTELHRSWEELQAERSDPEVALYRQLEASLGYDPDQALAPAIERFHSDRGILGPTAMTEVAATQSAGHTPLTARRLRGAAKRWGFSSGLGNGATPVSLEGGVAAEEPAWSYGEQAARVVRRHVGDSNGPVPNCRLADLCSSSPQSLTDEARFDPMAFSLQETGRDGRVVLRSRWETGRRFEMARLLGDQLLFRAEESLHPATGSDTFRQRTQRAFAAEFLCPYEALLDFLKKDFSETAQAEAGRHFLVSPWAVKTILVKKHRLPREALPDRGG